MYKEDSRLRAPKADAVLWRYMSYTKFVSLLTKNALFFSRADKLGDPFEGSLSPINIASRPEMYKGKPEDPVQAHWRNDKGLTPLHPGQLLARESG